MAVTITEQVIDVTIKDVKNPVTITQTETPVTIIDNTTNEVTTTAATTATVTNAITQVVVTDNVTNVVSVIEAAGGATNWTELSDTASAIIADQFVIGNAAGDTLVFFDLFAAANTWADTQTFSG